MAKNLSIKITPKRLVWTMVFAALFIVSLGTITSDGADKGEKSAQ